VGDSRQKVLLFNSATLIISSSSSGHTDNINSVTYTCIENMQKGAEYGNQG